MNNATGTRSMMTFDYIQCDEFVTVEYEMTAQEFADMMLQDLNRELRELATEIFQG
ncbi:MAG: hypothetical protein ACK5S6_00215 [bacterium]|jgi:hypothetical protein